MKRKKNPRGAIVMILETDLQKVPTFDEHSLTPLQKQFFTQISNVEQEKIRSGYGTVITSLESRQNICEFNMEHYQPPQCAIDSFARMLLPKIQEYYSHEENRRKFKEEQAKNDKEK